MSGFSIRARPASDSTRRRSDGTTSFGASTVYDSGDYPALFDELLRRLDYGRARVEQAARNTRPGARRGIGLAVYVEKTGLGRGIGNALYETLAYDGGGQLLSGTLRDYALPLALDVPPVDGFYQEVRATTNPLGLRGLGECGNPGLGAAIGNAVCDALRDRGVGITRLPLSPALVFDSIRGAGR